MLGLAIVGPGCAATTLAPSILHFEPVRPDRTQFQVGVRSGPRIAAGYVTKTRGLWAGDEDSFSPMQWGLAWDASVSFPFKSGLALHAGAQLEFIYPLPLPAVGAFVGISQLWTKGRFSIAPSLAARGATDFGVGSVTSAAFGARLPGSFVSADAGLTLSVRAHDDVRFGLVPFFTVAKPFSNVVIPATIFTGVLVAVRVARLEFSLGFGRVIAADAVAFNVPLLGVRAGEF